MYLGACACTREGWAEQAGARRGHDGTCMCVPTSAEAILELGPWGLLQAPPRPSPHPHPFPFTAGISWEAVVCYFYLGKAGPTGYSSLSFSTTTRHLPFLWAAGWGLAGGFLSADSGGHEGGAAANCEAAWEQKHRFLASGSPPSDNAFWHVSPISYRSFLSFCPHSII